MDSRIETKINDLMTGDDTIASLPDLYYEFKRRVNDPESTFDEIGEVILKDPGLSARVLKLVNSAFFGFSDPIDTISHAVNVIGLDQLNDLVLSTLIIDKFKGVPVPLISVRSFWEHSIATGLAAKHLAFLLNETNLERYFMAGLLHDIGRLFLCVKVPRQMKEAILLSLSERLVIKEAENQVLGFDHCDAGRLLLQKWNLPKIYGVVNEFHHEPFWAETSINEVYMVHLADTIAGTTVYGCNGEPFLSPLDKKALELIGMSRADIETELFSFLGRQFNEVAQPLLQAA